MKNTKQADLESAKKLVEDSVRQTIQALSKPQKVFFQKGKADKASN